MKLTRFVLGLGLIFSISITALAQGSHSSRNSLDWAGHYSTGKNMHLQLNSDHTYILTQDGRETSGKFLWNKSGNTITLPGKNLRFKVGEGSLTGLKYGTRLNKIDGPADVVTVEPAPFSPDQLYGGKWVLTELNGKPIEEYSEQSRKAFIRFNAKEGRFEGNGGCNNFGGTFQLPQGYGRIKFGPAVSTMRACIGGEGQDAEPILLRAIKDADNYTIHNGILSLNKARMAPLARFKMIVK